MVDWRIESWTHGHIGSACGWFIAIVFWGHATKLAHDLLDADKTYEARVVLGQTTTTGDVEGDVIAS